VATVHSICPYSWTVLVQQLGALLTALHRSCSTPEGLPLTSCLPDTF